MPFGLCYAPAMFQRLMERCMGDINLRDCLIYFDDIITFSSTFEEHLERLQAVFECLQEHNLKLKPSKCELFKERAPTWDMKFLKRAFIPIQQRLRW